MAKTLLQDLEQLLNYHSQEPFSDTPDFILGQYLLACLTAFHEAVKRRDEWYRNEKNLEAVEEDS
jgi:hypothetical protein